MNLGLDSQIQLAKNGILIQSRRILFLKNNLEMRNAMTNEPEVLAEKRVAGLNLDKREANAPDRGNLDEEKKLLSERKIWMGRPPST